MEVQNNTLADWQATGKDLNSVTEMANFISPYLHIDETIPHIWSKAQHQLPGYSDFDGDARNAITPDIGADEFDPASTATNWEMQNSNFPQISWSWISPQ